MESDGNFTKVAIVADPQVTSFSKWFLVLLCVNGV